LNTMFFTMHHCSCDERWVITFVAESIELVDVSFRFRECLNTAGTASAGRVGRIYFNMFRTRCFTIHLEKVCTKWGWHGCKRYWLDLKARARNPKLF
jgi:hypothetical protein